MQTCDPRAPSRRRNLCRLAVLPLLPALGRSAASPGGGWCIEGCTVVADGARGAT